MLFMLLLRTSLVWALLLVFPRFIVQGQTGSLAGAVIIESESTVKKIKVVATSVNSPDESFYSTTTADDGQFTFETLPVGRYLVSAYASGYISASDDPSGRLGQRVEIMHNMRSEIKLKLIKGGSLSGNVRYRTGQPAVGYKINLYRINNNGRRYRYEQYLSEVSHIFETDDRGAFRIWGLPSGNYQVACGTQENTQARGYTKFAAYFPETYYPGTTIEKEARVVELKMGEDISKLDFILAPVEPVFQISGRVLGARDQAIVGAEVAIRNPGGAGSPYSLTVATTDNSGAFTVSYVRPGEYELLTTQKSKNTYSEPYRVTVKDEDTEDIKITVKQGGLIAGRILGEDPQSVETQRLLLGIKVIREDGLPPERDYVPLKGDEFRIGGLPGGRIVFSLSNAPNVNLTRIERATGSIALPLTIRVGEEITDLRLIVRRADAVITGRLIIDDGNETPGSGYLVAAISAETGQEAVFPVGTKPDGRFTFAGLTPGTYTIGLMTNALNQPIRLSEKAQITVTATSGQNPDIIIRYKQ